MSLELGHNEETPTREPNLMVSELGVPPASMPNWLKLMLRAGGLPFEIALRVEDALRAVLKRDGGKEK